MKMMVPTVKANNTPSNTDELDLNISSNLFDEQQDVKTLKPNHISTPDSPFYTQMTIQVCTQQP